MGTKQSRRLYARDQAAALSHIAMRLQRCKDKSVEGLLRQANECLQRYKLAKFLGNDAPAVAPISETVAADLEAPMSALGDVIRETVAPYAYTLLVFVPDGEGGGMNYVSNANLDDVCTSMREFVTAHYGGES